MRRSIPLLFYLLLPLACLAQQSEKQQGVLDGGLGFTAIDEESYFTISFRPEITLGKFGLGLDLRFLYNTKTGHIRSKDWDSGYDYSRMIRYIRYGHKGDPLYTKIGTLDAVRLGHGFIMNYYTNEANYDERKIGLIFDLDLGPYGFESMTSNLGRLEVVGLRAYWRPLRRVINIPIIKNIAFGGSFVTDVDQDSYRDTKDGIAVWGLDAELPLIDGRLFRSFLYADFAQIMAYGSGAATGISAGLKVPAGILNLQAKLERRFLGEKFIPSYFDAFYEIDRYIPGYGRKEQRLYAVTEGHRGTYGELYARVLGQIELIGTFQRLDDQRKSGVLHLQALAPKAIPGLAFHATYDKKEIETIEDIRTLDSRSVARAGAGYKIRPYLTLYVDYIWSFVYDEEKESYKPQERIEPRLALSYNFNLSK